MLADRERSGDLRSGEIKPTRLPESLLYLQGSRTDNRLAVLAKDRTEQSFVDRTVRTGLRLLYVSALLKTAQPQ
jgi:hypothetical protein